VCGHKRRAFDHASAGVAGLCGSSANGTPSAALPAEETPMKSNLILGLTLAVPLALFAGCSSDDDTTNDNGGAGGAHAGRGGSGSSGRAGSGGRNSENGGFAGELSLGGSAGAAGAGETAGAAGDMAGESGAGGEAGAAAMLNDAQILKVLSTANTGEVSVAQVAKPALQNAAALGFAQMMIDEHGAANGQTLALVSSKHIAPEPSALSESLEADTATVISTLSTTPPAVFDKAYISSQVTMHQQVLKVIDARLIPNAEDADVKALLGTLRTSVATHLTAAQAIDTSLP
jgi:putative membrane protein